MTATTISAHVPDLDSAPTDRAVSFQLRWSLALSVLHAALAGGAFLVLGAVFDFPGILREPAGVVLATYNEDPTTIRWAYYAFTLSSLLVIPIAVLLRGGLGGRASALLPVATAFGVLAGLSQMLGFIRWTIVVPFLADAYQDPAASEATRAAVAVTYEFANRYLGMTVGEHLGWVFQGSWVLLLALILVRRGGAARWLGVVGVAIAALILVSTLEQFRFGFEGALETINSIGTTAFPFWLIVLTVVLLREGRRVSTSDKAFASRVDT